MADALSEAVAAVREATRDLPLSLARSSDVLLAGVQEAGDAAQALARGEAREPALWPLQDLVRQMEASASKADPLVNYHKALAEYAQGLLYPAATGDAASHVQFCWESAEFYLVKAQREARQRSSEAAELSWIKALRNLHQALIKHLRQRSATVQGKAGASSHSARQGPDASTSAPSGTRAMPATPSVPASKGVPPPPAPPVNVAAMLAATANKSAARKETPGGAGGAGGAAGGLGALFEEIKTGVSLRPVQRGAGRGAAAQPAGKGRAGRQVEVRQGTITLEGGKRWVVRGYSGVDGSVAVQGVSLSQAVHVTECCESMVSVDGKVNAVTMEQCTGAGLLLDSVVSRVEVLGCRRCKVQCTGTAPLFELDNCEEITLYLSAEAAAGCQIVTSRSASILVAVVEGAGHDIQEMRIPEQLVTKVVDGKLQCAPVDQGWE